MSEVSEEADAKMVVKPNRMRGMKIRDEFMCPITYELMREPVVASDGHTYEKNAIEKWLKANHISPRNGEPIDGLLIPNINLKKLIQDIIDEGGSGFYTYDKSNKDRLFDVCPEKILTLECLGPPESDWNQQSFQVDRYGCVGGRKHQPDDAHQNREVILFKDITVSRKHFEITQTSEGMNKNYYIRDLGSAGGTFIRIAFGAKKELHPGMIILLGKHQFTVSSIDDTGNDASNSTPSSARRTSFNASNSAASNRKTTLDSNVILSLVENAEKLIADFSNRADEKDKDEISSRLKSLTIELSKMSRDENDIRSADAKRLDPDVDAEAKNYSSTIKHHNNNSNGSGDEKNIVEPATMLMANHLQHHSDISVLSQTNPVVIDESQAISNYASRKCTLTCCAPDGSPLQGKSFAVGPEGAGMGRRYTNEIALYMKMTDVDGEERLVNVDTAISSEHARVEFDNKTGRFFICDGTPTKPSTNGTWYRLSGPHQESPSHVLKNGTEVLIGTVRFVVKESMTIQEMKVEAKSSVVNSKSQEKKS